LVWTQLEWYEVIHLSRTENDGGQVKAYRWDPEGGLIDPEALKDANFIIHLAGAGIADKRWSTARKKEIRDSRAGTTSLLFKYLAEAHHRPEAFISSSAIGFYGANTGSEWLDEDSPPGQDFLADVTREWENSVDQLEGLGIRTVKIRTGVVFSMPGGALEKIVTPIKFGVGAPLGSGDQFMSWIHIRDLCRIYLKSIEDPGMQGIYNGVAPNPVTNAELTHLIARKLKKPLWLPNVPGFALKIMLGELSSLVTGGSRISSQKIEKANFQFEYETATSALEDLLNS